MNNNQRKTNIEFQKELHSVHPEIINIEKYQTRRIKIKFKCLECGNKWIDYPPNVLKEKNPCSKCRKKYSSKVRQHNQNGLALVSDVKKHLQKIDSKIEIISQYNGAEKESILKCLRCGFIWHENLASIFQRKYKRICCKKCKIKHQEYEKNISFRKWLKKQNTGIVLMQRFQYTRDSIYFRCLKCGKCFTRSIGKMKKNNDCPFCQINKRNISEKKRNQLLTLSFATKGIFLYHNNNIYIKYLNIVNPHLHIHLLQKINGKDKKIQAKCDICHFKFNIIPNNFVKKPYCPFCSNQFFGRQTNNEFLQKLTKKHPNIIPLEKYHGNHNKIKVQCSLCKYIWTTTPHYLLQKDLPQRICPKCTKKNSHGEMAIMEFLDAKHIKYQSPYIAKDLYDSKPCFPLHYDFKINNTNILIEYQGCQHYYPSEHLGGEDKFKKVLKHDVMKKKWAFKKNYILILISYKANLNKVMEQIYHLFLEKLTK